MRTFHPKKSFYSFFRDFHPLPYSINSSQETSRVFPVTSDLPWQVTYNRQIKPDGHRMGEVKKADGHAASAPFLTDGRPRRSAITSGRMRLAVEIEPDSAKPSQRSSYLYYDFI